MKEFQIDATPKSIAEFPLYSDAHIIGELNDEQGPYRFLNMISGISKPGEITTAITLRMFWYVDDRSTYGVKTDTSKYHGGWVTDEISALVSLKLGIRVKAGAMNRSYDNYSDDKFGSPRSSKEKTPELNIGLRGAILPSVVKTADISVLRELYSLSRLTERQYVALVRSARMYQNAQWIAESEPELAWLMLISALETAANEWSLEESTSLEKLKASKADLSKILLESGGEVLLQKVADEISHTLGSTNKFIKFCLAFFPLPPEERPVAWAQVKWSKTGFRDILNKLYGYRSDALHGGTPFPAPLCDPPERLSKEDGLAERGALGLAYHSLGASWKAEDLPISIDTFNTFTNGVLNKWWSSLLDEQS
jgi:hypothetical protein